MPFVFIQLAAIVVIILMPWLATALPGLLYD